MGVPLCIDADVREKIRVLREFAEANPVDMATLSARVATADGKARHMAHMTRQTMDIPFGFMVTFSIEDGHPCGRARHLSMSVMNRSDRVPSEFAVWMVANEFGFTGGLETCIIWLEELRGHGRAINVVQPIA
jgi:hypothetical protein